VDFSGFCCCCSSCFAVSPLLLSVSALARAGIPSDSVEGDVEGAFRATGYLLSAIVVSLSSPSSGTDVLK